MNKQVDIFTIEIIKNALVAIGEEMFLALKRSSKSPIIYESLDYGIGVTDAQGRLISQGNGIPGFIGTLDAGVQNIIAKFDRENIYPEDVFILNDPYAGGGTHLSDVCMIRPIFFENELVAWTANKAHWTEIGGKDPGSYSADATEIYQEGLQFPGIKVFERGVPNQALLDLIEVNVRLPDMTLGDLQACSASLKVGEQRFVAVMEKYSKQVTLTAIDKLLEHGDVMVLEKFKSLPKGVFEAEDVIDEDGMGNGPFAVKVKVTITDTLFTLDFTGSSKQAPGPINCTMGVLISAAREVFMGIVQPDAPATDGCFRRLEVICPPGTLLTAERPAPVSSYFEAMVCAADVTRKALADVLPGIVTAGQFGSVCTMNLSGELPETGEPYLLVEPLVGGWGAAVGKDGESGQFCVGNGETSNIPVEITEARYGVLVEQYAFNNDSSGAGEYRGGNGVILDYRILSDNTDISSFFGRGITAPWGIDEGHDGSCNYVEVFDDQDNLKARFSRTSRYKLKKGDLLRLVTGNGGGWGNPSKRPKADVLNDIKNGFITEQDAQVIYNFK
ncbi:5-oxoprolinase [Shewanella sp. 10N.286.52.C2]|uniref:hydantoinase B/oxoprolinase family protein n=1 Tax=unclassified Shewanella TaxID=196818 RepID=UPI000C8201BA|nr:MULTISPECIES: hydantoinase B/oxoprolinase family protein [unclassified Shewanella]MDO6774376.1 hydantoinase B/oxoprolinase family protein [Shewanella sp. 3_MG-2023]PMG28847.1 5-oxoprolinase [Shewanella sp. 10N.286.52.C2]